MFVDINNNKQELELHKNCAAIHTWKSFRWTEADKLSNINLIEIHIYHLSLQVTCLSLLLDV